jgi:hypothetical protein
VLHSAADIRVTVAGAPFVSQAKVLLQRFDASGAPAGILSVLVQLPESVMAGAEKRDIVVSWTGGSSTSAGLNAKSRHFRRQG